MDPSTEHWLLRLKRIITFLLKRNENDFGRLARHKLLSERNKKKLLSLAYRAYPTLDWKSYLNKFTGLKMKNITTELTVVLHILSQEIQDEKNFQIKSPKKIPITEHKFDWNLVFVAVFKNEAARLSEWLDFHITLGVEHFFLYDNESEDNYREVLAPYLAKGVVTLKKASNLPEDPHFEWAMRRAYEDARVALREKACWVMFLDLDEFVFTLNEEALPQFLENYREYPGLSINWYNFGTSGIQELLPGELQTLKVIHRFPDEHFHNNHIKTISQIRYVESCGLHNVVFKDGLISIDTEQHPIPDNLNLYRPTNKIRINHYWMRSEGNRERKFQRITYQYYASLSPEQRDKIHFNRNEVVDTKIIPLVTKMLNRRVHS